MAACYKKPWNVTEDCIVKCFSWQQYLYNNVPLLPKCECPRKIRLISPLMHWDQVQNLEMWQNPKYWRQSTLVRSIKRTEVTVTRSPFDDQSNSSPFLRLLCRCRLSICVYFVGQFLGMRILFLWGLKKCLKIIHLMLKVCLVTV